MWPLKKKAWGKNSELGMFGTHFIFKARVRYDSPPEVDRIWGISRSYCNIPKAIFYLLKGD